MYNRWAITCYGLDEKNVRQSHEKQVVIVMFFLIALNNYLVSLIWSNYWKKYVDLI